jgi:hypothetical protein
VSEQAIKFTATIHRPDGVETTKHYAVGRGAIVTFASTPVDLAWPCCGVTRRITRPTIHPSRHAGQCRGKAKKA